MLTVLVLTTVMAVADNQQEYAYEHLKELECFTGQWEGTAVLRESPNLSKSAQKWTGKTVNVRANVFWAPGKSSQIVQSVWEVPGEVLINAMWVRGWDPASKSIKVYMFTTHQGAWVQTMKKQGDKWLTEFTGLNLDGSRCTGVTTTIFEDEDHFVEIESRGTVDGESIPDLKYTFARVKPQPAVPNSERLKAFEPFIGKWVRTEADGVSANWVFKWSVDKNLIENEFVTRGPDGKIADFSKGNLGWDAGNRRFTNWLFTGQGNPRNYVWIKTGDKTWLIWPTSGNWSATVTIVDENTWVFESGTTKAEFKRVTDK